MKNKIFIAIDTNSINRARSIIAKSKQKNFKIGCRPDGEEKFIGIIDYVRIYNRALEKKEVKKNIQ